MWACIKSCPIKEAEHLNTKSYKYITLIYKYHFIHIVDMVYWYSAYDNSITPHDIYVTTVTDICSDSPLLVFCIVTSSGISINIIETHIFCINQTLLLFSA